MVSASDDDFKPINIREHPTPDERAEYVMMRLEQFIREGRSIEEGMSFKKWQAMARKEISITVTEAVSSYCQDEIKSCRGLFIVASALITIGFWGTAVSLHDVNHMTAGIICTGAGCLLLFVVSHWRIRKWANRRIAEKRRNQLVHIENLNKRIKRLKVELEKEEEVLEEALRKRRLLTLR